MELPTLPANPTSKLLLLPLNFNGVLSRLKLASKREVYKISPGALTPQPTNIGGSGKTNFTLMVLVYHVHHYTL